MILLLPPKDMHEVMDSFGDCQIPLKESAFGKMSVKEQLLAILGRVGYKESNAGNDVQGNSDELLRTIYQHRVALMKAKKADKVKAIKEAVMAQYRQWQRASSPELSSHYQEIGTQLLAKDLRYYYEQEPEIHLAEWWLGYRVAFDVLHIHVFAVAIARWSCFSILQHVYIWK